MCRCRCGCRPAELVGVIGLNVRGYCPHSVAVLRAGCKRGDLSRRVIYCRLGRNIGPTTADLLLDLPTGDLQRDITGCVLAAGRRRCLRSCGPRDRQTRGARCLGLCLHRWARRHWSSARVRARTSPGCLCGSGVLGARYHDTCRRAVERLAARSGGSCHSVTGGDSSRRSLHDVSSGPRRDRGNEGAFRTDC